MAGWEKVAKERQEQQDAAPSPEVSLKDAEAPNARGASVHDGSPLMLEILPRHGLGKLLPYSRIEDVDFDPDGTLIILVAMSYTVAIRGTELHEIRRGLQRAKISSIAIGKGDRNQATIERIDITRHSDAEE